MALSAADDPAATLVRQAHERKISAHPEWRRLLHFRRDLLTRYQSDVDDPSFFLAPNGRRNPEAELEADLRAFFQPAPADRDTQSAPCRFPARFAWLKEQLHFESQVREPVCPRFDAWRSQMNAESVHIIFASAYMNNPASMYGHTFMRLGGKGHNAEQRLLDYSVNYAADVTTNNGFLFAVLGLTGGYRGCFSSMPYYVKVQEYNNLESRDLWEYPLRLTQPQVDQLLRHLWELGGSSIAYYFLNRNCSYQLLPLLEVVDPSLELSRPFVWRAIPMDTLRKLLAQPGLVGPPQLRPSHVRKLLAERAALSEGEISAAQHLAAEPAGNGLGLMNGWSRDRQVRTLDAAYDLFRYRVGFKRPQPDDVVARERTLLLLRNQVGTSPASPEVPGSSLPSSRIDTEKILPPERGHKTGRLGLSYGFTHHSHFEEFSIRSAVHDQDDPPAGYIPGSQLQMGLVRLRFDNDRKVLYPEQFTLVDLMSYSPWDRWVHHPSWKVNTGLAVAHDLDRDPENSLYWGLNGGSGVGMSIPRLRNSLVYALVEMDSGLGGVFRDNYRFGGGSTVGAMAEIVPKWSAHLEASYLRYAIGEPGEAVKWRLVQCLPIGRDIQLRATLSRQNRYKEVLLNLFLYW